MAAGRRGDYHHGNLRRALIDAGLALIARAGADALTLREAARRAGVSQAAPYRHFRDKGALLAAVAEEGFRAMTASMRRAAGAGAADPVGRLRELGLAYVRFARSHPAHFRVMFGRDVADRSAHPTLRAAATETFELLRGTIAECQRAGLVVAGDPVELAVAAWSATHGLASLFLDGQLEGRGADDPEALAARVTAAVFLGIAAPGALPGRRATGAALSSASRPARRRTPRRSTGSPP